jgi:predicted MFS family arabinose efflux permease
MPTPHSSPNPATPNAPSGSAEPALRALLFGNFVIGAGVMVVPGTLNDISASLNVSIPQAGLLITVAGVLIGLGAPLAAGLVAGWDRRRLLALSLLWYAVFMTASACAPDYAWLLPLRALAMIPPGIFTPQAAASVGLLVPPARRGRAITYIFLGWSLASVLGMPLSAWIGGAYGWRWAFGLVALLSFIGAVWVWRVLPDGLRTPPISRQGWAQTLRSPALMGVVAVTLFYSASQMTLFAYFAPYHQQVMGMGATALALLLLWFGAFGLAGNMLLSRQIDRMGPARAVNFTLLGIALSLALWPLSRAFGEPSLALHALLALPWALCGFACNSAQQARLVQLAPALASATIALNSSAIYAGQALGAAMGGSLIAQGLLADLHLYGLGLLLLGLGLSLWAGRRTTPGETG